VTRIPHFPDASSRTPQGVDLVARGQRLLKIHGPDHAAQHRRGDLLDRLDVVDDLVVRRARIGDLEEQHRVDEHHQVVLGDHRRAIERDDLLTQVDDGLHPVDHRDDEIHPGFQRLAVAAEPLDVACAGLRHDPYRPHHRDDHEDRDDGRDDGFSQDHGYSRG